jgi:hypothetical protein
MRPPRRSQLAPLRRRCRQRTRTPDRRVSRTAGPTTERRRRSSGRSGHAPIPSGDIGLEADGIRLRIPVGRKLRGDRGASRTTRSLLAVSHTTPSNPGRCSANQRSCAPESDADRRDLPVRLRFGPCRRSSGRARAVSTPDRRNAGDNVGLPSNRPKPGTVVEGMGRGGGLGRKHADRRHA